MTVSKKIRCALEAALCGNMQMALAELYDAMMDTAVKEHDGKADVSADENAALFLKEHFSLLLRLWPGMPISGNIKLPGITATLDEVQKDADGCCYLDDLLCWLLQTAGTWRTLPVQWHEDSVLDVQHDELHLPKGLVWALTLLLITRDVNLDEQMLEAPYGADPTLVDTINALWGKEEALTALNSRQGARGRQRIDRLTASQLASQ